MTPAAPLADQVFAIRHGVALGRRDDLTLLTFPGDAGLDALDPVLATALDLREAQLRQAVRLDDAGRPSVDLLVGFFRGTLHVLAEARPGTDLVAALNAQDATNTTHDTVVFTLDGPFAWEALARWDSPSAVGLPYLGVYAPRDGVLVIREGRTGEYGYLILAQRSEADAVWASLQAAVAPFRGVVIGEDARRHCTFEAWIFDLRADGGHALDALELQLTWRLDLQKDAPGLEAVRAHRDRGLRRRITALRSRHPMPVGATVTAGDVTIGHVIRSQAALSPQGNGDDAHRAVAVLDMPWASAGMTYAVDGEPVTSGSAPFVLNHSLFVSPQRHTWNTRDEIELPGGDPWPGTASS